MSSLKRVVMTSLFFNKLFMLTEFFLYQNFINDIIASDAGPDIILTCYYFIFTVFFFIYLFFICIYCHFDFIEYVDLPFHQELATRRYILFLLKRPISMDTEWNQLMDCLSSQLSCRDNIFTTPWRRSRRHTRPWTVNCSK